MGPYFYTWVATSSFYREYLRDPVRLRLRAGGRELDGITVLAQNSDPFTYFGGRPVRVCRDVAIDDGTMAIAVLRRAAQRDMGFVITRLFADRFPATEHRQIDHVAKVTEGVVESVSSRPSGEIRPFPVQVDGDYIGDHPRLELGIEPGALTVIA
jgi:diacylglycerol kinase family enzyme